MSAPAEPTDAAPRPLTEEEIEEFLLAPPAPPRMEPTDAPAVEPLADEAVMSPTASPWSTQRFNRRPIIALGACAVGLCSLMGYAGLQRYAESNADNTLSPSASNSEPALPRGTDAKRMAEDIIGTPHIGLIPALGETAPEPPAAPPEPQVPITSIVDTPPAPPPRLRLESTIPVATSKTDDEWHQARLAALREALVAPRTIHFDRRPTEQAAPGDFVQRELARVAKQRAALDGPTDLATAYQQAATQAAQLVGPQPSAAQAATMGAGNMPLAPGAPPASTPSSNARNDLRAFGRNGSNDRWQLPSQVEDPQSPYMLQAGSVIAAVLDSAVNSELPGPLIGHVSQPIYSSTGSHELLIPQGTAIFGEYSADIVFGQNRLLVAWQRLRFPNGQTLDIGAMPGADGVGRAGLEDQVDNHYFRLFGSALLLSLVTTGVTLTQTPSASGSDRISAGSAMSQALGLQFGQVTAQLLQKNLNVAPTLEIRNGYRFNIIVTKDLSFRGPYTEL